MSGWVYSSAPGEYDYSRRGEIVRCPWHGWEFDIRTGQSYFDPARVRVRRYEVTVESGAPELPQEEAPAVETYPVSVEQQNVVVEILGALPAST